MDIEEKIHNMKKVVLHLHLDGSLRPETVKEWLKEEGEEFTLEEVKEKLMIDKDCKDLNQYLEKFEIPSRVLQNKERIERATYELYEDLSSQNVVYAEVRFAPSKHLEQGLTYDEVTEAAIRGLERAKEDFGIDGSLILCCMRGADNEREHKKTLLTAKKYLNKGVCAIDLAGAEAIFKTKDYENIFMHAREKQVPFTIHAGEADGPESIKKAIEFGTKRLGHGIRCIEDEELLRKIIKDEIVLEVCPISNIQTQAVQGEHPLEKLYRKNVLTTISTDNNSVSNTDIEQEYLWVLENTSLTLDDLEKMNINAARAIFNTVQRKAQLVSEIKCKINLCENKDCK